MHTNGSRTGGSAGPDSIQHCSRNCEEIVLFGSYLAARPNHAEAPEMQPAVQNFLNCNRAKPEPR